MSEADERWDDNILVTNYQALHRVVAFTLGKNEEQGPLKAANLYNRLVEAIEDLHNPAEFVQEHLAAERFAVWLVLAPILGELAELNRDNDDGHVTGYEISLFLRRIHAALEAIGQGLHRFEEA